MGHAGRTDAQFLFQKWIEALVGKFDGVEDAREEVCVVVVEKQLFSSFKNNTQGTLRKVFISYKLDAFAFIHSFTAGVQPRWIQGIRRVDGIGVERLVYLLI